VKEIDELIEAHVRPGGPGAAIAVVRNGDVVHRQGYGLANIEWGMPITPDTVFRLASITKQFTACAIQLLARQGRLRVDDPVTEYLGDVPEAWRRISIRNLLNHTSGVKNYPGDRSRMDLSPTETYAPVRDMPLDFEPGSRFSYSNTGYFVLGAIIEKLGGLSYGAFVTENIFKPLNMEGSCYLSNEPIIPKRAAGYREVGTGLRNAPFLSMYLPYAAGALGSTIDDLIRWEDALRKNRILDPSAMAEMLATPQLADGTKSSYGFGWFVAEYLGRPFFGHAGMITGFSSQMIHFDAEALTVIVLANSEQFPSEQVCLHIARLALGMPEPQRREYAITQSELHRCAGRFESIQFPIEVEGSKLVFKTPVPTVLVPTGDHTFYVERNPDQEFQFEDLRQGKFQALKIRSPLTPSRGGRRVD